MIEQLRHLYYLKKGELISNAPGVLWIHSGGYITGMEEMVHIFHPHIHLSVMGNLFTERHLHLLKILKRKVFLLQMQQ